MPEIKDKYSIHARWSDEDECFIATCPEFPGLLAFGDTREEAIGEANVALELFIEQYEEEGLPLPEPDYQGTYSGQTRLRMPKWLHARLARQAEEEGVSLNSLMISYLGREVGAAQRPRRGNS